MRRLANYRGVVDDQVLHSLYQKASQLYGCHIVHVNSTYQGGGVAEMLSSLIPLLNDIGLDTGWRILHGNQDFFNVTKKFHNALQGEEIHLSEAEKSRYEEVNEAFAQYTHVDHDCVIIHDPQPLPFIQYFQKRQPWVWRCHVDLSHPHPATWDFLSGFALRYDKMIVSNQQYCKEGFPVSQQIIYPAIDPLSTKNAPMTEKARLAILSEYKVPLDKPLVTQISRFDKWKDPIGVVKVFKKVLKEKDCRLVLCGSMASDDPEGNVIYAQVVKAAAALVDSGQVILINSESDRLVNALQQHSTVVVQKSVREGFGLTVTEALWKGVPVVASDVGGIPLQIEDGKSGYLRKPDDTDGFAEAIVTLLKDPKQAAEFGEHGRSHVRKNFLITRLMSDYLDLVRDQVG